MNNIYPLQQISTEGLRVAVLGPESTGKTTLCQMLSQAYNTPWVEEFMRTYLQNKWDTHREKCTPADLLPICIGQMQAENTAAQSHNLIFCDTNLFEIMAYSYIYYGYCNEIIEKYAKENHYDLVFFTNIDVPWQADDLRDAPDKRNEIFLFFKQKLEQWQVPYVLLSGTKTERLQKASAVINKLLNHKKN